ncbi:hypothetical protein SASPL_119469 [Salvia splendens]|uniref:Uncharacterized protein n=1 Tax=Salvia splendens TaxID=180675 RepID=A0A8X8XMW1_SALSN|nr:protein RETICULATA-RELATED 1, chloroplastic-like [Salvia splendens]KAG6417315.1 hypothetical protein SASPL_119469 [Salvia splendens]
MSLCIPAGGFTAPNLHCSSHQRTGRNVALKFTVFANFSPSNKPSLRIAAENPFRIQCAGPDTAKGKTSQLEDFEEPKLDHGGDGGGGGGGEGDDGVGGGEGDDGGGEDEFGPIVNYDEVLMEAESRGVVLPADLIEAAKAEGLRRVFLTRYLDLQSAGWPLGFLMRNFSMLRNRMLADPSFLFKVGTEVVIDSCCATVAEYRKRGKEFWAEFELYMADLLVGIVVDVALVGMLAPYARIGKKQIRGGSGFLGSMQLATAALPSSVFEAERPGVKFSLQQRAASLFYKGVLYGAVGFGCGIIGQGIANTIMTAKRSIKKSEEDIPVPPLIKSAALWGVFLGISSNVRYQIINGLENLVEARIPQVAKPFTVGIRFANNYYGGVQFIEWAKLSGVQ